MSSDMEQIREGARMRVLIVIPAYNEAENIIKVVNNVENTYPEYDYIVVNDGSKDATAKICKNNGFKFLNLPINLGLSGAFQAGVKYAYEYGYDAVMQVDGDGQHQASYIRKLILCMQETEADIVIGSRFKESKKDKSLRMFGSELIRLLINITAHQDIADPTSGMRIYSKRVIKAYATEMNFNPEPDTISYLIKCGAKVEEVQVEMSDREEGESYLNWKTSIIYMMKVCFSIIVIQAFRKKKVLS